jgi:16S rRNA (uracil1498-N3)-methyltransferase
LRNDINSPTAINLFIGPEGGFSASEEEFARSCGIHKVTLGTRVLRAETAGLVASAAIMYEYGEMDKPSTGIQSAL